ncbi:MAG: adenylate/guanylate cyclase domain-containing protein, partial [Saprospiraceae bacterium]|nr:adenylate/guanylate cyclase domain-containing protein [Saprospiraceae bacterium]
VIFKNDNVFGDGVNIASRIESMGIPGSILVSKAIRDQISNKSEFLLTSLGSFEFKNVEEPKEVFALTNEGMVVPTRTDLKGKGKQAKQKRSKWQSLTAAIILIAGFIFAGFYFFLGERPLTSAENEFGITGTIAVFPFNVKGSPDIEYLGEGIVDLISTQLDEIPTLRSVDPNVLISRLSKETSLVRNPEEFAKISSSLGANKFILGSVIELGETLQFSATKYSIDGTKIITQTIKANQRNTLAETIDELIKKLVAVELEESGFEMGSLGAMTSENLESLQFYLKGEQAYRNHQGRDAGRLYNKAVELDSTFALAWMRLGQLAQGSWDDKENFALKQWSKYRKTMPKKWQDYHEAYMFENTETLDKYKTLIGRYGESSEFLNAFGNYLYYTQVNFGSSCLDAKPYYLRALELDPSNLSSIETMTKLAVIENDSAAIQQYLTMTDTTYGSYGYLKLSEFLFMDTVTDQQIQAFMDLYSSKFSWLYVIYQFPENKVINLRLIERFLQVRPDPFSDITYKDIKFGTTGQEKEFYKLYQNSKIIWGLDFPRFGRCLPATFMGGEGFAPNSEYYDSLYIETKDANTPWEIYAGIKYALALNLTEEAKLLKEKLHLLGNNQEINKVARYYDFSIRAFEARLAGNDNLALTHIDSAFQYIFSVHWIERFSSRFDKTIMAANIYANKGDFEKAISFYNPHQYMGGSSTFRGYATYQLSNWYEQIGDVNNSLTKCNLFLESYKNCDEKYQPWVEEVKARRERLISRMN